MRYLEVKPVPPDWNTSDTTHPPGLYDMGGALYNVQFIGAMPAYIGASNNLPIKERPAEEAKGGLSVADAQKLLATALRPDLVLK